MTQQRENPPPEHLGLLYRVSRALLKEGEYGELLAGLLDTLIEGFGADRGFVVVREAGGSGRLRRGISAVRRYPGQKRR